MELFGPNSWLTGFYLGALKAAAEMAAALGDHGASHAVSLHLRARPRLGGPTTCSTASTSCSSVDLGDRSVLKPYAEAEVAAGLLGDGVEHLYWSPEHKQLKYQLGDGCLIDQVLGQWHASLYGLGDVLDADQVSASVRAIYRYNFLERLDDIVNPCRVFGLV